MSNNQKRLDLIKEAEAIEMTIRRLQATAEHNRRLAAMLIDDNVSLNKESDNNNNKDNLNFQGKRLRN